MKLAGLALLAPLLACKPPPNVGNSEPLEPRVMVEHHGVPPLCELVEPAPAEFEIQEHDDWIDLMRDRELATREEIADIRPERAHEVLCQGTRALGYPCSESERHVLSVFADDGHAILVVEPHEQGVRSIELSRWDYICPGNCESEFELVSHEPLAVEVFEWTGVASEGHGNHRLFVFDDSLGVCAAFIDRAAHDHAELDAQYVFREGRFLAIGECEQILVE